MTSEAYLIGISMRLFKYTVFFIKMQYFSKAWVQFTFLRSMMTARVITTIYDCIGLRSRRIVVMTLAVIMLTCYTLYKKRNHTLGRQGCDTLDFFDIIGYS